MLLLKNVQELGVREGVRSSGTELKNEGMCRKEQMAECG